MYLNLQLSKVYEQITDEEKKLFMERYLAFMSVNGEIFNCVCKNVRKLK